MSTAFVWATRCIPGLSAIIVFALLYLSFIAEPFGKGQRGDHHGVATIWQLLLSIYTILLHLQAIAFPARVCWAIGNVIEKMKETAAIKDNPKKRKKITIKTEENDAAISYPSPLFVIILPSYKENMATMRETLRVLASHPQARHCYHVYLAMEEKEEKAAFKATDLIATFHRSFYKLSFTMHPAGIPGEAQGKSSNESWAGKQASADYPEEVKSNIIMTVMDADTHLSPRYFSQVAKAFTENPDTRETTMYVPPIVFDRNLHRVPLPVRTADLIWSGAGISSLYPGSEIRIPTSVYSLPMSLVEQVGGWDTGPGAIGEDMHMYLKCFFALSGNINVEVVYAAASQCNVASDKKGIQGYFDGIDARYKQALRHMWGAQDSGYCVRQAVDMLRRHYNAPPPATEFPLSAPNANWTAFYTSTGLDQSLSPKAGNGFPAPPKAINKMNCLVLANRMFEAHFLPIHLCLILATSGIYGLLYPIFLMPAVLRWSLEFSGWCRLIGYLLMLVFFYRYATYHRLCVALRREEMRRAGLLEEMEENDSFSPDIFQFAGIAEVMTFPLGGFIFGGIPALQAVITHIFTDRLTYVVSLKPQLSRTKDWKSGTVTP
ncbi:Hypothetical protein R9X50_00316300 [Acrodontium crateriforme]|uniref:Glycosyltransferase 2-like domain-containing protein n=1 Tax=Acrodontium crateriforme TaxID=150365 RepID=A0AAQ3M582_9PEZI|nr:Hypothetical protein R9X50_00316300 [Acrodontium crateriforme]